MSTMFDIVQSYFRENGWPVEQHEELPILHFEYEGDHGSWDCYARVVDEANQFVFLSVLSRKVPVKKRAAIAEFLTRANFGLNIGNFEMDYSDGEIRYKTSIDVTTDRLTTGLIDPLVKASLVAMDDYLPGIEAVLAGKATPSEAIDQVADRQAEDDEGFDLIM